MAPITLPNPYSGQNDETCSVSFAAQQQAFGGVSSPQTEAQFHASKLKGEVGVLAGKISNGEIPDGTKILSYETGFSRGFLYMSDGEIKNKSYTNSGHLVGNSPLKGTLAQWLDKASQSGWKVSIPQSVSQASKKDPEKKKAAKPLASPTPSPAVSPASTSLGSMSDEDVAAMFVSIKDTLAKEKGLNIKGANPELDAEVHKAIGEKIGYTAAEVKAKIDAYKAAGNKLSALKKKVLNGSKKVPDPQPNGVPTKATSTTAHAVVEEVKQAAEQKPTKLYSDEDIAAQYIINKDAIVAASNGQWTLYTKSDELEKGIYDAIEKATGYDTLNAKKALANYLASGKKLSVLKKQLIKQGALEPKADTLKKSGAAKTEADKKQDVEQKADEGYTPQPDAFEKREKPEPPADRGDITTISDSDQLILFQAFKSYGYQTYLSTGPAQNYEAFAKVKAKYDALGQNYTLLQLIRVVDAQGAKKAGVENGHLFEKQVAGWLTTPAGTRYVKDAEAKLAAEAEKQKKLAEAEKAAKLLEANQPALPADSALFQEMTPEKALDLQQKMLKTKPFGPGEFAGIKVYTGSSYREMNGYLRGLTSDIRDSLKTNIQQAQRGMRPSPENVLLRRGTGANQFLTLGVDRGQTSLLWGLTGKTFEDKGFLSTSAAGRAAFGGEVALEIECPVGTPMMYVDKLKNEDGTVSSFSSHPGENEMLLGTGMKYKILNVKKVDNTFVVRMRVVDWPGKER